MVVERAGSDLIMHQFPKPFSAELPSSVFSESHHPLRTFIFFFGESISRRYAVGILSLSFSVLLFVISPPFRLLFLSGAGMPLLRGRVIFDPKASLHRPPLGPFTTAEEGYKSRSARQAFSPLTLFSLEYLLLFSLEAIPPPSSWDAEDS